MPKHVSKSVIWIGRVLFIILVMLFIGGQFLQWHTGWADNGDYRRVNQLFTDRPAGFESNRPDSGTPEYALRYTNYWLPVWNFRWGIPSIYSAFSSTILLWIPGALLNMAFISTHLLYLVALSLLPRLLIGLCLVMLMINSWRDARSMLIWDLFFVLPLILMMSTANYAAYFNSFYQDVGSLVYLILLVTWLIVGRRFQARLFEVVGFTLLLMLTTAKSSNFYFLFLLLPLLFDLRKIIKKPLLAIGLVVLSLGAGIITVKFVGDRSNANRYHSLFLGVLVSSEHPEQRLQDIGINDANAASECRVSFYTSMGDACAMKYADKLSYGYIGKIILKEPKILYYHAMRLADNMQRTNIGLGQVAVNFVSPYNAKLSNAWSIFKEKYFPHGWSLYLFLGAEFIIALSVRYKNKQMASLAILDLILLVACLVDMWVAILGDGIADLVKHLFMANILFDLSMIMTFTLIMLAFFGKSRLDNPKSIESR